MNNLSIEETGDGPCIAKHIGTVQAVIEADIPKEIMEKRLQARDFAYGYELATPKEMSSLGESVIANGYCFATSTDRTSSKYNQVISGQDFLPGGVFFLPHEAKPSHKAHLPKGASPLNFDTFYQMAFQKVQRPFVFIGLFHFTNLHGVAISKSPTDGKNIFTHREEYYSNPEVHEENVHGFVMGAVAKNEENLPKGLESVLYINPLDKESEFIHHAHILTLNKPLNTPQEINPRNVDKCLHLFVEGTKIDLLDVSIFSIERVDELGE